MNDSAWSLSLMAYLDREILSIIRLETSAAEATIYA